MKKLIAPALALMMLSAPAQAQDGPKSALDLPPGHTLVNLSANERTEVDQDLLVASLQYQADNKDPRALQNEINSVMKKAVEKAKSYKDIEVSTEAYYVYPYEPPVPPVPVPMQGQKKAEKPEKTWRGSQGIQLQSKSADDLLELAGSLQDMGLVMNGLNYTVSPELMERTSDSLMEAALEKLLAKAGRAAKALGKSKADLIEVSVDTGGQNYPRPMMMKTMAFDGAAESMAAPVAEAGQSEINMTVSARALLKP